MRPPAICFALHDERSEQSPPVMRFQESALTVSTLHKPLRDSKIRPLNYQAAAGNTICRTIRKPNSGNSGNSPPSTGGSKYVQVFSAQ
jgi:hypothetical protein